MNHSAGNLLNNSTNQQINISTIYWKVGILIAVSVFVYYPVILSLIGTWSGRGDYSHGFLIPFISLYFVWHKRIELKQIPVEPNLIAGFIVMIFGSLMLLTGFIGSVIMVQQISILIVIPGIVLTLLGTNYLKALILPLSYLIFMIPPVMDLFIDNIHWPFQLFGATVAEKLLNIFNIPVFREVNFLQLPNITLEVANACSGLRYLISIIAISIPLAFFTQRKNSLRLLLIGSATIMGILINPLRIALIGIWTYYTGGDVHGPSHIFQGLFVSAVGFIFLFTGSWVLHKISTANGKEKNHKPVNQSINQLSQLVSEDLSNLKKFNQVWFMSIIILLSLGYYLYISKPTPVHLKTNLNELSFTVGEWKGENISDYMKPFSIQGADFETTRVYRNASGREIKLQIAYFESQQQDKELIHYTLQKLYDNNEEIAIPKDSHSVIRVNKSLLQDGTRNSLILYWYDLNGRIIADNYKAKFLTAIDGLIYRRTNGAIIIVSSNFNNSGETQRVLNDEVEFVQRILPVLDHHLP
jgi:EpsI family protein